MKWFMKRHFISILFFFFIQSYGLGMEEVKEIRQEIERFKSFLKEENTEEIFTSHSEDKIMKNFYESLKDIKENKYNNKRAQEISDSANNWGKKIREKYKEIIVDSIVINLGENMSYWFDKSGSIYKSYWSNESKLIYKAKIAIGNEEFKRGTKKDTYIIGKKVLKPEIYWKQRNLKIPYGHLFNSFGARKLELWKDDEYSFYACHGTNAITSIGKHISLGCIRFCNKDILILYELVEGNKTVLVVK